MGVHRLEDLPDPSGKAVLVRATLDLPLGTDGGPLAAYRAEKLGATLQWLSAKGARVTVFGNVGGNDHEAGHRLAHVHEVVESLAPGANVADVPAGASVEAPDVLATLVGSHDLFVNDSFQWSYLALPSLTVPAEQLPSAAGRSLEHDLEVLEPFLVSPDRPFVALLGGDRPALRLHRLRGLVLRADAVLVGGAMAIPLLQALGKQDPGGTPEDLLEECRAAYGLGRMVWHHVVLPEDLTWSADGAVEVTAAGTPGNGQVEDVGAVTAHRFAERVQAAGSVLWLGSLGRVEKAAFAGGTRAVGAALDAERCPTVLGGDALVSFFDQEGLLGGHVQLLSATDSALELLTSGDLPALAALRGR